MTVLVGLLLQANGSAQDPAQAPAQDPPSQQPCPACSTKPFGPGACRPGKSCCSCWCSCAPATAAEKHALLARPCSRSENCSSSMCSCWSFRGHSCRQPPCSSSCQWQLLRRYEQYEQPTACGLPCISKQLSDAAEQPCAYVVLAYLHCGRMLKPWQAPFAATAQQHS